MTIPGREKREPIPDLEQKVQAIAQVALSDGAIRGGSKSAVFERAAERCRKTTVDQLQKAVPAEACTKTQSLALLSVVALDESFEDWFGPIETDAGRSKIESFAAQIRARRREAEALRAAMRLNFGSLWLDEEQGSDDERPIFLMIALRRDDLAVEAGAVPLAINGGSVAVSVSDELKVNPRTLVGFSGERGAEVEDGVFMRVSHVPSPFTWEIASEPAAPDGAEGPPIIKNIGTPDGLFAVAGASNGGTLNAELVILAKHIVPAREGVGEEALNQAQKRIKAALEAERVLKGHEGLVIHAPELRLKTAEELARARGEAGDREE